MGKYGKKNNVSLNPLDFNITILGESGIGKTTIAKEICEKLVGEEGYIHFDIGHEDGAAAIQGIVSEKIEDWAKLKEVVDDIVENKDEDYSKLKTVIWDTLDELIPLAEAEAIRQYNKKDPEKKADTINSAWGGFGKGLDYATDLIINKMDELRQVGVHSIINGHLKRVDIIDPVTMETYSKLTADTTQRYFNCIKNKQHFVAVGYIDREIVKEKTGKKDAVTKKELTVNKAVKESRVISFRDDTYSVDSKSRFADIVDKIPFDADEFIKALTDAIRSEREKGSMTMEEATEEQKARDAAAAKKATEYSQAKKANKIAESLEENREKWMTVISENFSDLEKAKKDQIKKLLLDAGFRKFSDDVPIELIQRAVEIIDFAA